MKKPIGYTRAAYDVVKEAIETAGTTKLPSVSLALEDNISEKMKNWESIKGKKGIKEGKLKDYVFRWITRVGIYTTGDLQRIINQVGAMK